MNPGSNSHVLLRNTMNYDFFVRLTDGTGRSPSFQLNTTSPSSHIIPFINYDLLLSSFKFINHHVGNTYLVFQAYKNHMLPFCGLVYQQSFPISNFLYKELNKIAGNISAFVCTCERIPSKRSSNWSHEMADTIELFKNTLTFNLTFAFMTNNTYIQVDLNKTISYWG